MTRAGRGRRARYRPAQSGFVIVGFLLLISMVVVFVSTYLRHELYDTRHSPASREATDSADAVDSAVAYAEQRLRRGEFDLADTLDNGPRTAHLTASDLGDGRAGLRLHSVDSDGLGTTLLAEFHLVPALDAAVAPDDLPRLDPATVDDLLSDPAVPKHYYGASQTVSGADLYGLVVIEEGVSLALRDVTLSGCVVSEGVLAAQAFGAHDPGSAPTLVIDGDVRIEPAAFLPGVAVVMPDGLVTSSGNPSSLQCGGDLAAHGLHLDGLGALLGNVATVEPPTLGASIMQPGVGRGPRPWGTGLDDVRRWETRFVAFLPRHDSVAGLGGVTGFAFP